MPTPSYSPSTPAIHLESLRLALADSVRWAILDLIHQRGPLTGQLIAKALGVSKQVVSRSVRLMRKAGMLEVRIGHLNAIPEAFLVPGQRQIDYGPVVLRLDWGAGKS